MDHLVCFLIFFFSLLPIQVLVESKINGFTIDLIHRDSRFSPFYNKTATPEDLARKDASRSIARSNHFFQSSKNIDSYNENGLESPVTATGPEYVMKIFIGTPPVEITAIADTGSDLIWTPCSNSPQSYNPMQSSTYMSLSCHSKSCLTLKQDKSCGIRKNECEYNYHYEDKSFTRGVLSTDTISLRTTTAQPVSFRNSVFGCDSMNTGPGMIGLGGGPLSLVSQLGDQIEHKFSYCLKPVNAKTPSKLRFGTNMVISRQSVVSTPFVSSSSDPTFYYLNLQGISIGEKRIENNGKATQVEGNIVIDSGTTLTMLERSFYSSVEDAVKEAVGLQPVNDSTNNYHLCYDYKSSRNKISELTMVFHFTGADVTLKELNLFRPLHGKSCLAIIPTRKSPIFGNVAQINFGVEYNLAKKEVSFVPTDCTGF